MWKLSGSSYDSSYVAFWLRQSATEFRILETINPTEFALLWCFFFIVIKSFRPEDKSALIPRCFQLFELVDRLLIAQSWKIDWKVVENISFDISSRYHGRRKQIVTPEIPAFFPSHFLSGKLTSHTRNFYIQLNLTQWTLSKLCVATDCNPFPLDDLFSCIRVAYAYTFVRGMSNIALNLSNKKKIWDFHLILKGIQTSRVFIQTRELPIILFW